MDSTSLRIARRLAGTLCLTDRGFSAALKSPSTPHLFVDISAHGLGHLAQVAPVLNALRPLLSVQLTIRSALPTDKLQARIEGPFTHIAGQSDFGFTMLDAVTIDYPATALAYRTQHRDWAGQLAREARFLNSLQASGVLTDVAYLPLAAAAHAGIPSVSMCSLNWADLFADAFSGEAWAAPIHRQILDAYNSADCFLRLTPAMPMPGISRQQSISPLAALGQNRRQELNSKLPCRPDQKLVLIAFGGFDKDLRAADWPPRPHLHWLIPNQWGIVRTDMTSVDTLGMAFTDLLCSVDAVLTKPGYGTFTEAACNGTAVLYTRRKNWAEQDCLIDWLHKNARCCEISESNLLSGQIEDALTAVWQQSGPPPPLPTGSAEAAAFLAGWLSQHSA